MSVLFVSLLVSWSCQHSRQSLQIRESYAITDRSVLVGGAGLRVGRLRVNHFEHRGFPALVAQRSQSKAFFRQLRGASETAQLVHSRLGFGVERLDLRQQPAL